MYDVVRSLRTVVCLEVVMQSRTSADYAVVAPRVDSTPMSGGLVSLTMNLVEGSEV